MTSDNKRKGSRQLALQSQLDGALGHLDETISQNGQESDYRFIQTLFRIKSRTEMLQRHVFAKRPNLGEEDYEIIQLFGQKHFQCQFVNHNTGRDPSQVQDHNKCECGCLKMKGDQLPYCFNPDDNVYFGPGILLYFFYIKKLMLMVFLAILIFGVFGLIVNISDGKHDHNCSEKPGSLPFLCEWKKIVTLPESKTDNIFHIIKVWIAVPMTLVWAIGIRIVRDLGRKKNEQIDLKLDSSSDYCIWMEGLPEGQYNQKDIVNFLNKLWRSRSDKIRRKLRIKSVQIVYNTKQIRKMINEIKKTAFEMIQMLQKPLKNLPVQSLKNITALQKNGIENMDVNNIPRKFSTKDIEVKEDIKKETWVIKKQKINDYKMRKKYMCESYGKVKSLRFEFLEDKEKRREMTGDTVLVEFEDCVQKDEIVEHFGCLQVSTFRKVRNKITSFLKGDEKALTFMGKNIEIYRAPEPSDIQWVHSQKKLKKARIFITWIINFCLIGLTFGALMLLKHLSSKSQSIKKSSFLRIVLINFFNRTIWNILRNVVMQIQENKTKTQYVVSVMNKSYLAQSFNIIITPIILFTVMQDKLDAVDGLSGAVHDYQITAFLFMFFFNLVNVPYRILRLIVCIPSIRRLIIRYLCRSTGDSYSYEETKLIFQYLYEPPRLPVAGLYVYITSIVNQAFFFCNVQPIILFYLLFNLFIFYWMVHHLLIRQCKLPYIVDFYVFETVIMYAMNIPLIYALGSLFHIYMGSEHVSFTHAFPSFLCIIIWFISSQNPFGVFKQFTTCLQKKFIRKLYPNYSQEDITNVNNETEMNIEDVLDSPKQKHLHKNKIKRRECYYIESTMTNVFNFENRLSGDIGPYHNKFKDFCEIIAKRSLRLGKKSSCMISF